MDQEWLSLALRLIAIQIVACVALAVSLGFVQQPPLVYYSLGALGIVLGVICLIALYDTGRCFRYRGASPTLFIVEGLKDRRPQLTLALAGLALAVLQLTILTWTKATLPLVQTYWADPYLAELDRMILGTDAYKLAHLIPIGSFIDQFYVVWFPWLAVVFSINLFREPSAEKSQAALSFFLTFALVGVCGMFLLPSGGPIFYERLGYGIHFKELSDNLPFYAELASDYLWAQRNGEVAAAASGISAMPSMHVAMAAWTFLTLRSINRWLGYAGGGYASLIVFGSVYLGWHYLTDGIAGALGALACWHLARIPNREWRPLATRLRKS